MDVLTAEMIRLIEDFSLGSVATVDDAGRPAVSPKATFVVVDERRLAFGDLRSPKTVANIRDRPAMEVLFTDVLARRAVRVAGTAEVVAADGWLRPRFDKHWGSSVGRMRRFVLLNVTGTEMILSPAYDTGWTAEELRRIWLDRMIEQTHGPRPPVAENELGQPIGNPVSVSTPPPPPDTTVEGRYCRVEPLLAERHGADLHRAYAEAADDGDWTYLPYGPWPSEAAFLDWLRQVENREDPMFFAIGDIGHDRFAGLAAYLRIDPGSASIEVGHIHLAPGLQRSRAATEAMYLLMDRVFDAGYRRYEWKCDALNAPSRAAAVRLGFRYEGTFRQATIYKGRNRDTAWYSIIDGEWPSLAAEYRRWLDPANFDPSGRQRSALRCRR